MYNEIGGNWKNWKFIAKYTNIKTYKVVYSDGVRSEFDGKGKRKRMKMATENL